MKLAVDAPEPNTLLAMQRNVMASERTLMAALKRYRVWIGMGGLLGYGMIECRHPTADPPSCGIARDRPRWQ